MKKGYYKFNESVAIEGTGISFHMDEVVFVYRQYTSGLSCECCGKGLAQANVIVALEDGEGAKLVPTSIEYFIAAGESFKRESPFGDGHFNKFFSGKLDFLGKKVEPKVEDALDAGIYAPGIPSLVYFHLNPEGCDWSKLNFSDEDIANAAIELVEEALPQWQNEAKAEKKSLSAFLNCEPKDITALKKFYAKVKEA